MRPFSSCSLTLAIIGVLAVNSPGYTQSKALPTREQLAAIEERGRDLFEYDRAAWLATDAVLALSPPDGVVTHYIARRIPTGWVVAFGRLSAEADSFLKAYQAELKGDATSFVPRSFDPPVADSGYFLKAARAITAVRGDFPGADRPYNTAVIPTEQGEWWVYLFPAQVSTTVWVHGADWRYLLSADGEAIREKRQMHRGIIEYDVSRTDPELRSYYHTEILQDMVTDTDVYLALARPVNLPEYVVSESFLFRIDTDGSISCTYRREVEGGEQ